MLSERYRLIRPVGQGAQASVWVAEHLALSTHVAVKLIDPELAKQEEARERFRREATAAAQLRSAHVVQIIDHGIEGEQPFIVMELLEGEDLFERLARRQRLTLQETSKIVIQVARALTRAHGAGIVHRDLKPENFFISANEDEEVVKILDFGIAKVEGQGKRAIQRTTVGTLMGTPHYMSPEQVKGLSEVDYRADLWALGVIVYQCVTGQLPFDSEGVGDLLIKISLGEIPVPSRVNPELPPSFDVWFARACDRDPERRFDSARELAESLARIADLSADGASTVSSPRPPPMPTAAPRPAPTRPPPGPPRPATGAAIPKAPPLPRMVDPLGAEPARPNERPLPPQHSERPSARPPPSEGAPLSARLGDRAPLPPRRSERPAAPPRPGDTVSPQPPVPRPTGAPPSAAPPLPAGSPRGTGVPPSAKPPLPAGSPRGTGVPPSAKPPLPTRSPRGTGVPPSAAPPLPAGTPRPTGTPLSTEALRSAQPTAVPLAAVHDGLASAPPLANTGGRVPGPGSSPSLEIDVEDFEGDLVHDTEEAPAPSALAPEAPAMFTPQGSAALAPEAPAMFTPQGSAAPAQPALATPAPLDLAPAAPDAPADPSPAVQPPSAAQPPSMRSPEPPAPPLAGEAPPAHTPVAPPRDAGAGAAAVDAGIAAAPASLRAGPSRPQVAPAVASPERALPSSGTPDQWVKSSSVSGMAHEGALPEFDAGSRRRRLVRWGVFLLIALTGAVVWQVVRSQLPLLDTPTAASASAAPAPAQPEPSQAPPPPPTSTASAAPAVDPGQPAASATVSAPPKKRRAPPPPKRPRKQQQPKVDDLTLEAPGTPAEPAEEPSPPAETSPEPESPPHEAPTPQPEQ
ncbi:uncharacterized protein SOCE26_094910 [Sorangium cellulosum]|uniref:Protein kinase domain-containing protein n=1 Tax=Sorangium cellulosum TaxID=56 RepID=A0A2L0F8Q9_SORCE|nr:uncharacterized protein SOCE26_094910 [Sorangium cellulosum]